MMWLYLLLSAFQEGWDFFISWMVKRQRDSPGVYEALSFSHKSLFLHCSNPNPALSPKILQFPGIWWSQWGTKWAHVLNSASSLAGEEFSELLTLSKPVPIKRPWCLPGSKGSFLAVVGTVDHLFPSHRSGCAPVCALHGILQELLQDSSCARCTLAALLGDCPVWSHSPVLGLADVFTSCPKMQQTHTYIYIWHERQNQKLIQAKLD